jgi:UDP-xylose:glucoside alpha-1,3-xylosyltransferase
LIFRLEVQNLDQFFEVIFQEILTQIDSVLYIDTDLLFFDVVENLWEYFYRMDSNQMIGVIEEAPYNWFFKNYRPLQPIIGKYGVNSGVLLMNLTRMREFGWISKVLTVHKYYAINQKKYFADQGIINIVLEENPGKRLKSNQWHKTKLKPWNSRRNTLFSFYLII